MGLFDRIKSGKDKKSGQEGESSNTEKQEDNFAPPSGPPPGYPGFAEPSSYPQQTKADPSLAYAEPEYAPPTGPPPTYHNWQSVPDTSLLPPPPAFGHRTSSSSNAERYVANQALHWERVNPPFPPDQPLASYVNDVRSGDVFLRPPEHALKGEELSRRGILSMIRTIKTSTDHCYLSSLPLYFERVDSPFRTEVPRTVYYELTINQLGTLKDGSDSSVAIGYCVGPYPTWRLPGWQRGSFAIHSDDGSRYVYDDSGGEDFTSPIRAGETIGLGVRFSVPHWTPEQAAISPSGQPLTGEVFLTRNGTFAGGWNIQEGLDKKYAFRAQFLDGKWDLYGAIGTYGHVEVLVNFGGQRFAYDPTSFAGL